MPTKTRLKPRLAVGLPFKPVVQTKGPASVIDESTGETVARVGEGGRDEFLAVLPKRKPVPMQFGGIVSPSSGGGQDAETRRRRARLETEQSQLQQLQAARRDIPGLEATGQRQVAQASANQRYDLLGVPRAPSFDVPLGTAANFGPFAQESVRTPEQLLSEQFSEQNQFQSVQDELASLNEQQSQASLGGTRGSEIRGPTPSRRTAMVGGRTVVEGQGMPSSRGGRTASLGTQGGNTAIPPWSFNEQQRQFEEYQAEQSGLVPYEDPFNPGQRQYITPAESKIRKFRDEKRIEQEIETRYPEPTRELEKLDANDLIDILVRPERYGAALAERFGGDPQKVRLAVLNELAKKGFSPRAIRLLQDQFQARLSEQKSLISEEDYAANSITPEQARDLARRYPGSNLLGQLIRGAAR